MRNSKNEDLSEFIEEYIPKFMREGKIPGVSVAVVQNDDVIFSQGFGARDLGKSLPATPQTLYCIGSCTKSFVAMAIMQLMENGKLSVEDPVTKYLPLELGSPETPITIHHLLTHSSGIPSLGTSFIALSRGLNEDTGISWGGVTDFYRLLNHAGEEVAATPGDRFFYFNAGYRMLGHIIQNVSGERFDTYITEHILKPLGMQRSTLSKTKYQNTNDRMTPYWKKPDGSLEKACFPYPEPADNPDFSFIAAAGGILSSVSDLTKYLQVYLNEGNFNGIRLVRPESIKKMLHIHSERPPKYFGRRGYGYGWGVTADFLGQKLVAHGGSVLVSTAHLAFLPQSKVGVAMAANAAGFPYEPIVEGILAILLDKKPQNVVPALQIKEKMGMLTGTYEIYEGIKRVTITKKEGLLYLEQKDPFTDSSVPLIPQEPQGEFTTFYILSEGVKQPVTFEVHAPDDIDLYIERYRYHKVAE